MNWENETLWREFILLGLSSNPNIQTTLFVIFLTFYLIILIGNSLIISATITEKCLHTPMYIFLTNLSFLDICYSSSTVPRMLRDLVSTTKTISFQECSLQIYISLSLAETECILLAIMAYDRYIAICYPLHYNTIINKYVCIRIVVGTWIGGFVLSVSHIALIWNVRLCGHNKINHFMCEMPELLSLECKTNIVVEFVFLLGSVIILMLPVTFIIISYCNIIVAILKITTSAGRQKVFSTCASHITVVTLFYGSAMATYMKSRSSSSPGTDKIIAIFYIIITPTLNPLIYTLRNNDMKNALRKMRNRAVFILHMVIY